MLKRIKKKKEKKSFTGAEVIPDQMRIVHDLEDMTEEDVIHFLSKSRVISTKDNQWYKRPIDNQVKCDKAIYILSRSSLFRRICYNLQKHRHFENFIMFLIAASSLKLATDTYTRQLPTDHVV